MSGEVPSGPGAKDRGLLVEVARYLEGPSPRFVMVVGAVGAGKSSFLHALLEEVAGPRLLLLYSQPMSPSNSGAPRAQLGGSTSILFGALPTRASDAGRPPLSPRGSPPRPTGLSSLPAPETLQRAIANMLAQGGGTVVVDSWDRASETVLRELIPDPTAVYSFTFPVTEFAALESELVGMPVSLALGLVPELAAPLQSIADMLIELAVVEERSGMRARVITVSKVRGASFATHDQLYAIEQGRVRTFPDLPPGFAPPGLAPEPDPEPSAEGIWPGNTALAQAFGRLRYGGLSSLTLSPECSDTIVAGVAAPVVAHVLTVGGRVVWIPAPSQRPSHVIASMRGRVPDEWLRERLRVLSPIGEDGALGDLGPVVLPLRREFGAGRDLRSATAPGVGPIFPDAHRFLRLAPGGGPSLYVMSIEGLKASAAAAEITLNAVTLPAVLAAYARLPKFHGFGYGRADDPLAGALLPMVDIQVGMEVRCGRPVLYGIKPRTPTYILDWPEPTRRLRLVPSG